jgi:hypothetical protein
LQAVAQHPTGTVVVQYALVEGADRLRLVVRSYEHHLASAVSSAKVAPVSIVWLEERANEPGAALALLDHRMEVEEPGLVAMTIPGASGKTRRPDAFYERVAFYVELCREHGLPAAHRLAQDNGVPVSTTTRWIREARRRGYLKADTR